MQEEGSRSNKVGYSGKGGHSNIGGCSGKVYYNGKGGCSGKDGCIPGQRRVALLVWHNRIGKNGIGYNGKNRSQI